MKNNENIKIIFKDQITGDLTNLFRLVKVKVKKGVPVYKKLLLVEARYRKLESDNNLGVVKSDSYDISLNKIRKNVIDILEDLEEDHLIESFLSKEVNEGENNDRVKFENRLRNLKLKRELANASGRAVYLKVYDDFLIELERSIKKHSEMSGVSYKYKEVESCRIYSIEEITIKVMPCVDDDKRNLWIGLESSHADKSKDFVGLGVLRLLYSDDMNLIWRNREKNEKSFSNYDLAYLITHEVFEEIMIYNPD